MSDLVGNPEDRFSQNEAPIRKEVRERGGKKIQRTGQDWN